MAGINIGGILLGYLAVPVFGLAALVALALWAARRARAALVGFAAGWLGAAVILALATLTFLDREYHRDGSGPLLVVAAVALFVAGVGQFVAALRGPRVYAPAFAGTAVSLGLLVAPFLGDRVANHLGVSGRLTDWQTDMALLCFVVASLIPASGSLLLAVILRQEVGPKGVSGRAPRD